MLDPKKILEVADLAVRARDAWASRPSDDTQIAAAVESTCLAVNAYIRDAVAGVAQLIVLAVGVERGNVEIQAFNYAAQKILELVGAEPVNVPAPPSATGPA